MLAARLTDGEPAGSPVEVRAIRSTRATGRSRSAELASPQMMALPLPVDDGGPRDGGRVFRP